MTMHALVSDQGTAMSETALCGDCLSKPEARDGAIAAARTAGDWQGRFDGAGFEDCSGNEALECTECGTAS